MDLSKAFDSVSHSNLIEKLSNLGIKGPPLSWLKSYLTKITQFVEMYHLNHNQYVPHQSKLMTIKHGVPQGSILGPLLFLCYIKGLPTVVGNNIKTSLCLYADDTNLKISGKMKNEIELLATQNLNNINNFFSLNQVLLNLEKTKFMEFSSKSISKLDTIEIRLDEIEVEQVTTIKFLGFHIDSHLCWDNHIDYVTKKVSLGNFMLYRLSKFCTIEILKVVYFAHINSIISFGINIYGATSKKNLNRILILQKRAIRIMLKLDWLESVREHFKNLNIMTVYSSYLYYTILYTKFNSKSISLVGSSHGYETRHRGNILIPRHRLKFYEKKTSFIGGKCINILPDLIKNENNFTKFKSLLKQFIIDRPLYSIEEFFEVRDCILLYFSFFIT
uniref:Reverse transcriptase domain-containing protein n=1 Tax=Graphocephala atropunctata TaxID=36148 RepID=A0A1B6KWR8_9HEMI